MSYTSGVDHCRRFKRDADSERDIIINKYKERRSKRNASRKDSAFFQGELTCVKGDCKTEEK